MRSLLNRSINPLSFGLALLVVLESEVCADYVRLKDGSAARGKILNPPGRAAELPGSDITLELLGGMTQTFPAAEIAYVLIRPLRQEEYEHRLDSVADTVEGQLELAEWCRKNGLEADQKTHLQRVLDLDPGNQQVHKILGEVLVDGDWIPLDQKMAMEGRVRYQGRYVKPEEIYAAERAQTLRSQEKGWLKKISKLRDGLGGPLAPEALRDLDAITDPAAVRPLLICFQDVPDIEIRKKLMKWLTQIHSVEATKGMVATGLFDSSDEVSEQAFASIPAGARAQGVEFAVRGLKSRSNKVVNRAASGIARMGGQQAIDKLIKALSTEHDVPVQKVVTRPAYLYGGNPRYLPVLDDYDSIPFGYGYGFPLTSEYANWWGPPYRYIYAYGGPRIAPLVDRGVTTTVERRRLQNPQVLESLRELTSVDFGYDQDAWGRWWRSQQPVVKAVP